jgi:hypothetical protein
MEKEDVLVIIFLIILIAGLVYLYQNLGSFECSVENSFSTAMNDINYEFEPEGSLYSKTKIFRFTISSSRKRLEYFGMKITKENGEVLFFENRTEPEGSSIVATINLNETEKITVNRFFKKKCYSEIQL